MKHRLIILVLFFLSLSCNSIFYQPNHHQYVSLDDERIVYQDYFIPGFDGNKIHVWILPCKGKAKGTVVQFHGNAENMSSHFLSLYWITDLGYNLVTFDYRGYGDSEGKAELDKMRRDGVSVLRFVNKLDKNFLGKKLIYHGQSLGGVILMESLHLINSNELPDAVILESTFLSYRQMAFNVLSRRWYSALLIPAAFFLISDMGAPVCYTDKLPALKYLVIHGEDDMVVPFQFGFEIFRKLKGDKRIMVIQHGHHLRSFLNSVNQARYMNYLNSL